MNIRKIIKEEVNNFDWASDIPSHVEMPSRHSSNEDSPHTSDYSEKNHEIMNEVFRDFNYMGWELSIDNMTGTLEWDDGWSGNYIYATPHYNEDNIIPVVVHTPNDGDEYYDVTKLDVPIFDTEYEAEKWYREVYPKLIVDTLKEHGYGRLFE
jgi:hypothetical protein